MERIGRSARHLLELIEEILTFARIEAGRERRSGQLVWSGGGGWVFLRGDRQDPASLGVLELR